MNKENFVSLLLGGIVGDTPPNIIEKIVKRGNKALTGVFPHGAPLCFDIGTPIEVEGKITTPIAAYLRVIPEWESNQQLGRIRLQQQAITSLVDAVVKAVLAENKDLGKLELSLALQGFVTTNPRYVDIDISTDSSFDGTVAAVIQAITILKEERAIASSGDFARFIAESFRR